MATSRPGPRLKNNPFSAPSFRFPEDLGGVGEEPFMVFDIRDSVAKPGASKGVLALPMPSNGIGVSYNTDYEEISMGVDQLRDIKNLVTQEEGGAGALANQLGKEVGAKAADSFTQLNLSSELERQRGAIVNPHMAALFKGVGFRTFTFNYQMLARSREESDAIRNIIYRFKYHMHPSIPRSGARRRFMLYPENFVIGIYSPEDLYLFKISTCALINMSVDYAGSGVPAFFKNTGAPVDIRMSLQFKELEVLSKEKIELGF